MILQTSDEKEIYDERQKLLRSRLVIEALCACVVISLINNWVMEFYYKWAESYIMPTCLIITLCFIYLEIRLTVKGCLIGTVGQKSGKHQTAKGVISSACFLALFVINISKRGFIAENGTISNNLLSAACFLILTVCGIYQLCAYRRAIHCEEETNESEGEEK